ncbi:MAG TPA: nuclear transport factor 2 family protein [Thermoleophilaceae bacterium]|jgi:ketosteroid isomerase-like protein
MRFKVALLVAIGAVAVMAPLTANADRQGKRHHHQHPRGHHPSSVRAVVREHIDAVEDCDAARLVDGYSRDAKLFFPDGVVVQGRQALTELYEGFVKSHEEGGLCGITATPVDSFTKGGTAFVKFRVEAPFLAEEYFSTDGYVIRGGKILSEVSTFDASKLKFK